MLTPSKRKTKSVAKRLYPVDNIASLTAQNRKFCHGATAAAAVHFKVPSDQQTPAMQSTKVRSNAAQRAADFQSQLSRCQVADIKLIVPKSVVQRKQNQTHQRICTQQEVTRLRKHIQSSIEAVPSSRYDKSRKNQTIKRQCRSKQPSPQREQL